MTVFENNSIPYQLHYNTKLVYIYHNGLPYHANRSILLLILIPGWYEIIREILDISLILYREVWEELHTCTSWYGKMKIPAQHWSFPYGLLHGPNTKTFLSHFVTIMVSGNRLLHGLNTKTTLRYSAAVGLIHIKDTLSEGFFVTAMVSCNGLLHGLFFPRTQP